MSSEKQAHPGAPVVPVAEDSKRVSREHIDRVDTTADDVDEKRPIEGEEGRDHTGAAKKSDPEEIRLVRKLDYRIMVSCGAPAFPRTPQQCGISPANRQTRFLSLYYALVSEHTRRRAKCGAPFSRDGTWI